MDIDFTKFEQDLTDGNQEAIKSTLLAFFDQEISAEDRAEILLNTAMIYASVKNKINAEKLELLQDVIASLKEIDEYERTAGESIDVDNIRRTIQES